MLIRLFLSWLIGKSIKLEVPMYFSADYVLTEMKIQTQSEGSGQIVMVLELEEKFRMKK